MFSDVYIVKMSMNMCIINVRHDLDTITGDVFNKQTVAKAQFIQQNLAEA